jgi:hypothetical protein
MADQTQMTDTKDPPPEDVYLASLTPIEKDAIAIAQEIFKESFKVTLTNGFKKRKT